MGSFAPQQQKVVVMTDTEPTIIAPNGSRFFRKGCGLLAVDLARAVSDLVPCGYNDLIEAFYVYEDGVWKRSEGPSHDVSPSCVVRRHQSFSYRHVLTTAFQALST